MKLEFIDKTIIVTGATRGIGKQIADDLFLLGANLILTGTNQSEIDKLNEKSILNNWKKTYYCVNFSDQKSLSFFVEKIKSLPLIHGLVNNAGINHLNSIENVVRSDWDQMVAVNLTAPAFILQTVATKMINQNYGRVVNIASIFSKISKERRSVYSATKFGLHGLTVGVSNDVARYQVLVNTLSPGFIMTELTKKNLSETERADMAQLIPAKRIGTVSDISKVVVFLLSDLNTYLTGQNIVVDGGFTNV